MKSAYHCHHLNFKCLTVIVLGDQQDAKYFHCCAFKIDLILVRTQSQWTEDDNLIHVAAKKYLHTHSICELYRKKYVHEVCVYLKWNISAKRYWNVS